MKTETANTSTKTETFIMPADVATRLLSNPKNKMTAKSRKRAWAARTKFMETKAPILTYPGGGFVRTAARLAKMKKQPRYAEGRSKTGAEKLEGKLKVRNYGQLLTWERRTMARIKALQRLADALESLKEGFTADKIRERIENLHAIGGLLQTEIDTRG